MRRSPTCNHSRLPAWRASVLMTNLTSSRSAMNSTGRSFGLEELAARCSEPGNSETLRQVALVIDDLISFDPFIARGIRIYGEADGPIQRTGMVGPGSTCGSL